MTPWGGQCPPQDGELTSLDEANPWVHYGKSTEFRPLVPDYTVSFLYKCR